MKFKFKKISRYEFHVKRPEKQRYSKVKRYPGFRKYRACIRKLEKSLGYQLLVRPFSFRRAVNNASAALKIRELAQNPEYDWLHLEWINTRPRIPRPKIWLFWKKICWHYHKHVAGLIQNGLRS